MQIHFTKDEKISTVKFMIKVDSELVFVVPAVKLSSDRAENASPSENSFAKPQKGFLNTKHFARLQLKVEKIV